MPVVDINVECYRILRYDVRLIRPKQGTFRNFTIIVPSKRPTACINRKHIINES